MTDFNYSCVEFVSALETLIPPADTVEGSTAAHPPRSSK